MPERKAVSRWRLLAFAVVALSGGILFIVATCGGWQPLWDFVTCRVETKHYPSGGVQAKIYYRRWDADSGRPVKAVVWYESGERRYEMTWEFIKTWDKSGRLVGAHRHSAGPPTGVVSDIGQDGVLLRQDIVVKGKTLDSVNSPPWFTEEQIQRAFERPGT